MYIPTRPIPTGAGQLVRHRAPLWLIVRLGGLLGPGLSKNPVFDLLHDVPLRVKEESEYQYISTDRMAEMTFHLIEKEMWGEIFNICGKGTVSLKEIRLWLKKPLRYLGDKVPQERYEVNIEKIGGLFEMPASRDVARDFVFSGLKRTK
jgi:nucleoside-diphosphate-sugar epimerase